MDRATSKRMTSATDQSDLTSGNACWETPPLVFEKLNKDFGPFEIDLTADSQRHLCKVWFGPDSNVDEEDALVADWHAYGKHGYSNPPYGPFVQKMLAKAVEQKERGFATTLLLPMRVTNAFKEYVIGHASDLLFCSSRITFSENGLPRLNAKQAAKGKKVGDPAMFDSIIVRFYPGASPLDVNMWHVPPHVTREDLETAFEIWKEGVLSV